MGAAGRFRGIQSQVPAQRSGAFVLYTHFGHRQKPPAQVEFTSAEHF